jgi:hypothetical protein
MKYGDWDRFFEHLLFYTSHKTYITQNEYNEVYVSKKGHKNRPTVIYNAFLTVNRLDYKL